VSVNVFEERIRAALEIIEHLAAEMGQDFASVKRRMNRIGKRTL
jgi:hypothetical protein